MAPDPSTLRRDEGLTLVELIIVTTVLGLVATVIAAAFVAILQVSPATQYRIDDARSVRALQTYLVRDVASTPPRQVTSAGDLTTGGYIFSDGSTSFLSGSDICGAGPGNILHMTWTDGGVRYHANYRIDGGRVIRTYCAGGSMSTLRLAGDVATVFCAASGFSTRYSFGTSSGGDIRSVEICVRSLQTDTGLDAGGDTRDIVLSVTSRNYVGAP